MLRHQSAIFGESYNTVLQVQSVNPGITLPVLEGLQCQNPKIYKNM